VAVVAAAVAIAVAVALSQRGQASPRPIQAKPSQQFGDTADLMRRLERKKHVLGTR
jgi:archaellin